MKLDALWLQSLESNSLSILMLEIGIYAFLSGASLTAALTFNAGFLKLANKVPAFGVASALLLA
jgi:hypothetical protein